MFLAKSNINTDNLYDVSLQDFAIKNINDKKSESIKSKWLMLTVWPSDLNNTLIQTLNCFKAEDQLNLFLPE